MSDLGRGERWLVTAFAVAAIIATVPFFHEMDVARWAVLFASLWMVVVVAIGATPRVDWLDAAALAFAGWAGLSLLWSPDPLAGGWAWLRLLALVALFLALRRVVGLDRLLPVIAGLGIVGILVLDVTGAPYGGFGNSGFMTEALLVAISLAFTRAWWLASFVAVVYLVGVNPSHLEWVVLAGLLAGWCLYVSPLWGSLTMALGAFLALPVILGVDSLKIAVLSRLEIWAGAVAMWLDAPLAGHGLGSFAYLWPSYEHTYESLVPDYWRTGAFTEPHVSAGAAHNEPLEVLASLGLVGLAIVIFGLVAAWRARAEALPGMLRGRLTGALGTVAVLSLVGFPLQSPAVALLAALALAAFAPAREGLGLRLPYVGPAVPGIVTALMLGGVVLSDRAAMSQLAWAEMHRVWNVDAQAALIANARAHNFFPADQIIRRQVFRSYARLYLAGGVADSPKQAEKSDALYRLSASASPDDRGLLLARLAYLTKAERCGVECAELLAAVRR